MTMVANANRGKKLKVSHQSYDVCTHLVLSAVRFKYVDANVIYCGLLLV